MYCPLSMTVGTAYNGTKERSGHGQKLQDGRCMSSSVSTSLFITINYNLLLFLSLLHYFCVFNCTVSFILFKVSNMVWCITLIFMFYLFFPHWKRCCFLICWFSSTHAFTNHHSLAVSHFVFSADLFSFLYFFQSVLFLCYLPSQLSMER